MPRHSPVKSGASDPNLANSISGWMYSPMYISPDSRRSYILCTISRFALVITTQYPAEQRCGRGSRGPLDPLELDFGTATAGAARTVPGRRERVAVEQRQAAAGTGQIGHGTSSRSQVPVGTNRVPSR